MINTYSFANHRAFLKAQSLIRDELSSVFRADWETVVKKLSAGQSHDLRNNLELMVQVENCIIELLRESGVPGVKSVQFPVNVRLVSASPSAGYLSRPFATDYPHCDVWSGAPRDSLNVFLYLEMVGDCPRLKLFQSMEHDAYTRDYRGPYVEYRGDVGSFQEVPVSADTGTMYVFSTYCPHQTVRGSGGFRISIDLRLRSGIPYLIDNARVGEAEFSTYSPGVPGQGIYWTRPEKALSSFSAKCEFEMEQARRLGAWAATLRETYIQKITTRGVFN